MSGPDTTAATEPGWFVCPKPALHFEPAQQRKFNKGKACEVTFAISNGYNGGILWEGGWYRGFRVPPPDVPAGWKLTTIGCGPQLNARPPYITMVLEPI